MNPEIIYLSEPINVHMADEWFEFAAIDHFWIHWRFQYLMKYLDKKLLMNSEILEIGCGSGIVMQQFKKYLHKNIDGCDLNESALNKIQNINGKVYLYNIFDVKPELTRRYDIILLLDVIEHIDDDHTFLKYAIEHLKDDGLVVINVPALNSLYSKYDTVAGHRRRYSKKMIKSLFKRTNLSAIDIKYWGLTLIPFLIARKMYLFFVKNENVINRGFKTGYLTNIFFSKLMQVESKIIKNVIGSSIIAIGKK